jgi:hypothetical protein
MNTSGAVIIACSIPVRFPRESKTFSALWFLYLCGSTGFFSVLVYYLFFFQ